MRGRGEWVEGEGVSEERGRGGKMWEGQRE